MRPKASDESRIAQVFLRNPNSSITTANERAVLNVVRQRRATSRQDVIDQVGLTKQSVCRMVGDLIDRGLMRTGERIVRGVGKPSTEIELVPSAAYSFGVSIMTDAVSTVLMDLSGSVLDSAYTTLEAINRESVISWLDATFEQMIQRHVADRERIFGIGVGMCGFFVGTGNRINPPELLDDWALVDFDQHLAEHFRLPVWVENDGNVAATGESMLGVGLWASHFAYFYFTSGFGGGIVIDGKAMRGAHGNAGELSILLKVGNYTKPGLEELRQILVRNGVELPSVAELIQQFDPTWGGIEEWIDAVAPSLSLVATAVAAINDPDAIVLGGRLPRALGERLIPHIKIENAIRRDSPRPLPRLVTAEAEGDSVAIGAAMLPLKQYFFSS